MVLASSFWNWTSTKIREVLFIVSRKAFTLIVGVLYLQINGQFFRLNWIVPTTHLVRLDQAARFSKLSSQPCYRRGVGQTFAEVVHSTKTLQFWGVKKKVKIPKLQTIPKQLNLFSVFFFGRTGKDPMRSTQPLLSIILSTFCRSHLRLRGQGIERRFSPFESLQLKFWHQESSETCGSAGSAGLFFGKQWIASKCWLDGQIGDL